MKFNNSIISNRTLSKFAIFFALFLVTYCDITEPPIDPPEKDVWTVSGPVLFVSDKSGTMQLYSMQIDGSNVKQLTDDPDFPITDAKWSPDGTKIALSGPIQNIQQRGATIYIVNANGTNRYKIANEVVEGVHYGSGDKPNWSFDSKSLVFSRIMYPEALGNFDIYTIDVDGKNEKRITATYDISEMWTSFGCDKNKILAMTYWNALDSARNAVAHFAIDEFDFSGNVLSEYEAIEEMWSVPVYNNDCTKIAFKATNNSTFLCGIYSMELNGSNIIQLTKDNYKQYRCVTWSEKNLIYAASNTYNFNKVIIADADGNFPKDITPFEANRLDVTSINLSY